MLIRGTKLSVMSLMHLLHSFLIQTSLVSSQHTSFKKLPKLDGNIRKMPNIASNKNEKLAWYWQTHMLCGSLLDNSTCFARLLYTIYILGQYPPPHPTITRTKILLFINVLQKIYRFVGGGAKKFVSPPTSPLLRLWYQQSKRNCCCSANYSYKIAKVFIVIFGRTQIVTHATEMNML